jgi:hypothetical protein
MALEENGEILRGGTFPGFHNQLPQFSDVLGSRSSSRESEG